MQVSKVTTVLALLFLTAVHAAEKLDQKEANTANPIRRVVTMLQMMENKVRAEGKKEEELFEKYMCYCETSESTLGKSIADAGDKIPQVESDINEAIGLKAQLEQEIADARTTREEAKAAQEKATSIREKEHKEWAAEDAVADSNIAALGKAITAIEKGMSGGFLQTSSANLLRNLMQNDEQVLNKLTDYERETLTSFLEGKDKDGSKYAPASGEIVGMLKQMQETMMKDEQAATADENAAAQSYEELMAAKKKEIDAATAEIETKLQRVGELGVEIVMMKEDLSDTQEALMEDRKFMADLSKNCATKKKEWAEITKTRNEELLALADCIKMLNDDDALELFKKTLPSGASASLIQVDRSAQEVRHKAIALLKAAQGTKRSIPLDLVSMALTGKKVGFEKVIKLIDDMVGTLKQEQIDDEAKKDYCNTSLDVAEDKAKEVARNIKDLETTMADAKGVLETVGDEIKALQEGIVALDKSVVKATEQRKDENAEYTDLMASNGAAKQLIELVKNRMNKFYNPKLYKPPPKRELTEEERITLNMGGTLEPTPPPGGIAGTGVVASLLAKSFAAPPPPPEAPGPYKKKGEESNGVMAMLNSLIAELDKETQEAAVEEKNAQEEYEEFMTDCTTKRAEDSKTITDKEGAKAEAETELQTSKDAHKEKTGDLMALKKYIHDLHTDCDWLLENYDLRKEARASEIDALKKAKAVLSGANFSLLQTKDGSSQKNVARHHA